MAKIILVGGPSFALFNPSLHASLGCLYLAAALRQAGHEVKIQDCHKMCYVEDGKLQVHADMLEPCDILGVSIVTPNAEFGGQLAMQWPAKVKVGGGPHVTYILDGPHERFKTRRYFEGFDYLMTGECEESFVKFCNALKITDAFGFKPSSLETHSCLAGIPGLAYFDDLGLHKNPQPPLPEVTKLPMPAYDLWENYSSGGLQVTSKTGKSIDAEERKIGSLWTARGCLPAGTLVELGSGVRVPIESLSLGDAVKCFDMDSFELTESCIMGVSRRVANDLWDLVLDAGEHFPITGEHPVWTMRGWVRVEEIEEGDFLLRTVQEEVCGEPDVENVQENFLHPKVLSSLEADERRMPQRAVGNGPSARIKKVRRNDPQGAPSLLGSPSNSHSASSSDYFRRETWRQESNETPRGSGESFGNDEEEASSVAVGADEKAVGRGKDAYALGTLQDREEIKARRFGGGIATEGVRVCGSGSILDRPLRFRAAQESGFCEQAGKEGDFGSRGTLAQEQEGGFSRAEGLCKEGLEGASDLGQGAENDEQVCTARKAKTVWCRIVSKALLGRSEVFNITVCPHHNYLADGYLVHNCPYGCTFCADARTKLREETLEQVEAEVKALAELGVTALRIWDDVLTIKDKRCRELVSIFHDYGMLWRGWSRVNLTNPDLFRFMASHGCTELGFGVEHGSARMLKAMNKGTNPEANEKGVKICQDAGIVARAYLLIGFPGENWESIEEMRSWLDKVRPDAASLHMFQPYPGSAVWNTPEKFGVTLPDDAFSQMWELNDEDPKTLVLDLPTMTKDELWQARRMLHDWITDNISLRLANR